MINLLFIDDRSRLSAYIRLYLANDPGLRIERVFSPRLARENLLKTRYQGIICISPVEGEEIIRTFAEERSIPLLQIRTAHAVLPSRVPRTVTVEGGHCSLEFRIRPGTDVKSQLTEIGRYTLQCIRKENSPAVDGRNTGVMPALLQEMRMAFGVLVNNSFEWVSTDCAVLLGYSCAEMRGKPIRDLFAEEAEYVRFWREAGGRRDPGGWGKAEVTLQRKDQDLVPCRVRLHRINPVNPTKGHMVLLEDISGEHLLAETIEKQEREWSLSTLRYQESLETARACVIRTDLEGDICFFNAAAGMVFGFQPAEVLSKNIVGTIVPPGSRYAREMLTLLNDMTSETEVHRLHAFENQKKDGKKFWMAWNALPLRDPEGRITEVLLVGQDITGQDSEGKAVIRTNPWKYRALEGTDVSEDVFDHVFHICIEISREGRESKKIGTSFVMGDTEQVLKHSRQCAINAFGGVPQDQRMVQQQENRENIKNFAQIDGAFVIRGDGLIVASSRHFIVEAGEIDLPMGYGTRHAAVAGITKKTQSVGIVVSESGGIITVFRHGAVIKQVVA